MPERSQFSAVSYPLHLYSSADALENLPRELNRNSAQRALVLCGRSMATRTDLITRIRKIIGANVAGVYEAIQKDAPLDCVLGAVDAARQCNADMLIAVGAGSVLKAARIVAILLGGDAAHETMYHAIPAGHARDQSQVACAQAAHHQRVDCTHQGAKPRRRRTSPSSIR